MILYTGAFLYHENLTFSSTMVRVFWDKPSKSFILWPYFWNVEFYKILDKISEKTVIIDRGNIKSSALGILRQEHKTAGMIN